MTRLPLLLPVLSLAACDVPLPPGTAGTDLGDAAIGMDGGACARAIVVVESDYASTNVALLGLDGAVRAGSIASSATAAVGLTAPLSGDVVVPTQPPGGGELVLIDRASGAGRLVFVDPLTTGQRELRVDAGFYANPKDYVRVSETKAYVTRYQRNPAPGKAPFDTGSDVLVVDPEALAIVASIPLDAALGGAGGDALPRPDKIVLSRGRALVLVDALSPSFDPTAAPHLVTIDTATDQVTTSLALTGMRGCVGLALSPDGGELAVSCLGPIESKGTQTLDGSGVALVDVRGEPVVTRTFAAAELGDAPVGFFATYAAPGMLLLQTFGHWNDVGDVVLAEDSLLSLDTTTGAHRSVLQSAGEPFTIGGITCDLACGACFVADAARQGGVVHRFPIDTSGALGEPIAIKVERRPGLPPRYLGAF